MHECGHGSMTGNLKVDKFIQSIAFAIGNTCSGSYWNNQHNKHHACPQKLQHDVYVLSFCFSLFLLVYLHYRDLNTLPFVAFCKDVLRDKKAFGGYSKTWIKLQVWKQLCLKMWSRFSPWIFFHWLVGVVICTSSNVVSRDRLGGLYSSTMDDKKSKILRNFFLSNSLGIWLLCPWFLGILEFFLYFRCEKCNTLENFSVFRVIILFILLIQHKISTYL